MPVLLSGPAQHRSLLGLFQIRGILHLPEIRIVHVPNPVDDYAAAGVSRGAHLNAVVQEAGIVQNQHRGIDQPSSPRSGHVGRGRIP